MEGNSCKTHFEMFAASLKTYPDVMTGTDLIGLIEIVLRECCSYHSLVATRDFAEKDFRLYSDFAEDWFSKDENNTLSRCIDLAKDPSTDIDEFLCLVDELTATLPRDTFSIFVQIIKHFREDELMEHFAGNILDVILPHDEFD